MPPVSRVPRGGRGFSEAIPTARRTNLKTDGERGFPPAQRKSNLRSVHCCRARGGEKSMKRIHLLAALLTLGVSGNALAPTDSDLKNAAKSPDRILTYGMSYSHQRFSPLKQINRQTVSRLDPAWSYSLDSDKGEESQPLLMNGVMYITSHDKTVALDAVTGKELWKSVVDYPQDTAKVVCCGIVNRGGALYNGKFYRTLLDGR